MELLRQRRTSVVWLLALAVGGCLASAFASTRDVVSFDAPLLNHAVTGHAVATAVCDEACASAGFHTSSDAPLVSAAGLDFESLPLSYEPGAVLSALSGPSTGDDDGGILHVDPRWGMKRFLLAVFFLGGLIRYLTSAAYRQFVSDVLNPFNW